MSLDPARWLDATTYLKGDLRARLVECVAEMIAARHNWSDAKIELARQQDVSLGEHWGDSVAAQGRAKDYETRHQANIVEQCEASYYSLRDEVDLLRFLMDNEP